MYDWLDDLTDEVVLTHPTKVRAIADARIKTDKIDSETLAHLLRSDLIPAAYAPSKFQSAMAKETRFTAPGQGHGVGTSTTRSSTCLRPNGKGRGVYAERLTPTRPYTKLCIP